MYLLVTNNEVDSDEFRRLSFDEFLDEANSEDGVNPGDGFYIDINSVPSEDIYDALVENITDSGKGIDWITFTEDTPSWFSGVITPLPDSLNSDSLDDQSVAELASAISLMDARPEEDVGEQGQKVGRIITFGSAKGGSGKTFTSIITAYYYAKDHPNEKVCILDLDVEEPQVGIAIKTLMPTVKGFYADYSVGNDEFEYLKKCRVNTHNYLMNKAFPSNLDFYLTPREIHPIRDEDFWQCVMKRLFSNYDMVILDTGTTYTETDAIISAYKVADKVNLVTMANLASTVTVGEQVKRLTGEIENNVYTPEDEIEGKINLVVTNTTDSRVCQSIITKLNEECPIIATFGNLSDKINDIQILGKWDMFDNNQAFREGMRNIYA